MRPGSSGFCVHVGFAGDLHGVVRIERNKHHVQVTVINVKKKGNPSG